MRGIFAGFLLVFLFLSVSAGAQVAVIPEIGTYPEYGDGFLYLAEGGYGELPDADVTDMDYTTTDFSVEAIVDARVAESVTDWNGILLKGHTYLLWDSSRAGWGLGFYRSNSKTVSHALYAKVGDGTEHVSFNHYLNGVAHIVMAWNRTTKTLELFVNGVLVKNQTNPNIDLSSIDNTYNMILGRALGDSMRNVLMVRWWGRKLSDQDVTALAGNWANNGDDRVPPGVSTSDLVSEWLMDGECAQDGSPGTGYLKDSAGSNHLQLMGNAELKTSRGKTLTMVYPADGQAGVDKSVTLKADGGDAGNYTPEADLNNDDNVNIFDLSIVAVNFGKIASNPSWNETADAISDNEIDVYDLVYVASRFSSGLTHPMLYFFQVDTVNTFGSANLKESGWIPHYGEYRPFLVPGKTYYWRVKAKGADGNELPYTSARSFITEPATTWYVRPVGGDYGSEDGSSYSNAWDGPLNIVFNETGVEPGDELYVCGLHYHTVTSGGSITEQGDIVLRSGGSESSPYRITIRGDCPGDQGIVWNAYKIGFGPWTDEGGGVYSIDLPGQELNGNYFQDVGIPDDDSYVLLNITYSVDECRATPGSFYKETPTKLYVHATHYSDPAGRIWGNRWGYEFNIPDNNKYITFKDLKFYSSRYRFRGKPNITHLRWENCTFLYGESTILEFSDGNHYMEILDSEFGYASTPIYLIVGGEEASNYVFARNYIHDCGTLPWHGGDNHAFGIQGGNNGIVEDNYIYHCRDGIIYYLYRGMDCMNNTIRRNYIRDIYQYGYLPTAIGFGCSNVLLGNTSGNRVYDNIIVNATRAMYFKWPDEMEVYNNIIVNSYWAFNFAGSDEGRMGARVRLRNNIAYNISEYFMKINGVPLIPENYGINSDYNLFYTTGGDAIFYHAQNMTWEEWTSQDITGTDHLFDPHSLTYDPMFENPRNYDFHLQSGSPAIDNGTDVGLTADFEGNPIVGIPDIGAFEYTP